MMKALALALTAWSSCALAGTSDLMCSTSGLTISGDSSLMRVLVNGSAQLPCLAVATPATNRGRINYISMSGSAGLQRQENTATGAWSVYANDDLDSAGAPTHGEHRTNFFAVTVNDRRQILVALEQSGFDRNISVYELNLDNNEERLLGRVSRQYSDRASNLFSVAFNHEHHQLSSISINQASVRAQIDVAPQMMVAWEYGMLMGGHGERSIESDNELPVNIYLNDQATPFVD